MWDIFWLFWSKSQKSWTPFCFILPFSLKVKLFIRNVIYKHSLWKFYQFLSNSMAMDFCSLIMVHGVYSTPHFSCPKIKSLSTFTAFLLYRLLKFQKIFSFELDQIKKDFSFKDQSLNYKTHTHLISKAVIFPIKLSLKKLYYALMDREVNLVWNMDVWYCEVQYSHCSRPVGIFTRKMCF